MKKEIIKVAMVTIVINIFMIVLSYSILRDYPINNKLEAEEKSKAQNVLNIVGDNIARIYISDTENILELNIEEYIACVVASEMPANFNSEALKAQAIAARTYYYAKRENKCCNGKGADICDGTHCQAFANKEEILQKWPNSKKEEYWNKINDAVLDTKGKVLVYKGELIKYPQYFATSWGKTETKEGVPYLVSIESKGEEIAPKYKSEVRYDVNEFINKLRNKYNIENIDSNNIMSYINIQSHTEGGAVKDIKIGDEVISGTDFRSLFGTNSTNFQISVEGNEVIISCIGYGHGIGMSQWGAEVMAREGKNYAEILKHYYKDIDIYEVN